MKNKNILILIVTAILFLLVGYFLGKQVDTRIDTSNVATTTNDTVTTSIATTSNATSTEKIIVKKPLPVITNNYIRIGQRVLLNGVYITPIKVAYDSRCPKDVQCIQAGSVDLGVLLENSNLSQNVIITQAKPFVFAGKTITLTGVAPVRMATKTLSDSDYRFTFTVKN